MCFLLEGLGSLLSDLPSLSSSWYNLESPEKMKFQEEFSRNCLCWWLMWEAPVHGGQHQFLAGGPGLYKKYSWTRTSKQANCVPPFFLPWVPSLSFSMLDYEEIHQNYTECVSQTLFFPHCLWSQCSVTATEWKWYIPINVLGWN